MLLMTFLLKYEFPANQKTNVKVCNMITKINEAETLIKHVSCDYKCKFNSAACNSEQKLNNDECQSKFNKYCAC